MDGRDFGDHGAEPDIRDWLAALIAGSNDAIISKDLSGRIQSWNHAATRIFGYAPEEAIGQPITMLIPEDRLDEEQSILAQIRLGHRVDHFETIRRHKDGSEVELSLTISPIRDAGGAIVGASKIARDISEKRLSEERLLLLMNEMQHRIKNLFALASAVVSLSARSGSTAEDVVSVIHARLSALARAHDLTLQNWQNENTEEETVDLLSLVQTVLEPYHYDQNIKVGGDTAQIDSSAGTGIALLIHEFATNAAKYGALSVPDGRLSVFIVHTAGSTDICWEETGGPRPDATASPGFGSRLETSLISSLGAEITRDWDSSGLRAVISLPK